MLRLVASGCSDARPSITDAGPTLPDAGAESCQDTTDPETVDFFGEPCQAAPYPVNTTCHTDDRGWCIDGVCRPMCASTYPRCPGGAFQFVPAGACYCVPRPWRCAPGASRLALEQHHAVPHKRPAVRVALRIIAARYAVRPGVEAGREVDHRVRLATSAFATDLAEQREDLVLGEIVGSEPDPGLAGRAG